tara:strand:+ start:829 stop:1506 length:678 start_codon:yes stop_codon:yes gene_type:complete
MEKLSKFKKVFNRIYHQLFVENFDKKLNFEFPRDYSRLDMINYFIKKNDYKSYLEIGCDKNQIFSQITLSKKIGVDPYSGGNVRKTSDDFFKENEEKFDLIFIDGLHVYEQVKKDIINSINFLNKEGVILVHDCLPDTIGKQAVPRYKMQWNGDVWKAIVDLRQRDDLEIHTCFVDQGIGIIKKQINSSILKINKKTQDLKFSDFYHNHKEYLRIINLDEFKKIY